MELATGLAVRVKTNGIRAAVVPRAHRDPTPLDWERWKPTIAARYKGVPARVLIGEMNAEGLHVTEKSFRDHLQKWGMNDKNRRGAAIPRRRRRRRALQFEGNGDKTSKSGTRYNTIARNSSRPAMLYHENIHNLLQTPQEMLVLQRTLKGVLDWQQHIKDSHFKLDYTWEMELTFAESLTTMHQCVQVNTRNPLSCEKIAPQLWRISAELRRHIGVVCTPLTILRYFDILFGFGHKRNSSPWYYETSRFLLNAAVEALPDSHSSLLLLRLLFSHITPSQLIMIYEVGSEVMEQFYGKAAVLEFRVGMHKAASRTGLGATFGSYADALCAAISDGTDLARLYDLGTLYLSMGQHEKSSEALHRCLAQCEGEGGRDSTISLPALKLLYAVQHGQNDFVGEEITLQKILKTTLARDRRELHASEFSVDALDAISRLDEFYANHSLSEQRDALHLEYPSVFEL